ncbi:C3a anaphylatoxin chemotactic receptor-like [Brachyhypopomus gauderio]|uniref:C3a anaphylatoxin chemotactic receptor-like n=1 Tax=Brachyhypopomus gauderio TaxID=698409 RepID=UPI0040413DF2
MDPTSPPCNVTACTLVQNVSRGGGKQNAGTGYEHTIALILQIVVLILGTVGNSLVIYVTGYKMKTSVNSVWFLNLAMADFLFTFFLILNIVSIYNSHNWPFGLYMCKCNTLVAVLNMFTSIFLLTAISLDRCLSTCVVVWAQNKRTPNKARIACFFIWMAGIMCSVPFATYRTLVTQAKVTYCATVATGEVKRNLIIVRFVMGFFIPFIIILSSYMAIGVKVRSLQRQNRLKPFRIILTVILAFFLCWFPFHIQQFCSLKGNCSSATKNALTRMGPVLVSLAYLNSCLNPILYVFMCEEFKTKLKKSLLHVLENALAEEHLAFLSSRHSTSSRNSDALMKRNGTATHLSEIE